MLLKRCAHEPQADVWEEFIARTRRMVSAVVFRVAGRWGESRPEVLEELVQECYLHLYAKDRRVLREFKPREEESVFAFLKVVAANITNDQMRAQCAAKRGAGIERILLILTTEVALSHPKKQTLASRLVLREIETWLSKRVSGPDSEKFKTIFWLYYRQGMSANSIAQIKAFGLSTKGVESVIYRLTRMLRDDLGDKQANPAIPLAESKGTGTA